MRYSHFLSFFFQDNNNYQWSDSEKEVRSINGQNHQAIKKVRLKFINNMGTQVSRQTVFEIKKGFKLKFICKGKFERNLRVTGD